ncbi:plastocyanin [Halosimplex carlsbadense 2-9-1]|uniref:Plastocyanin n=1 Tax=Halosimplex carlsbadense 2-9-1 TaxID=797114 RepID=M0CQR7_9EURY|nr:plastocyanin/azurin family copper-binding protein [Halosimplex carlsbadense]ELZ24234.1 plastocyanin [Halosimplex carlsbadense 2-9-1]
MYDRRALLRTAGAVVAGSAGLAGCGSDGGDGSDGAAPTETEPDAATPAPVTVDMTDGLKFDPATVTVERGTTVVWETVGSVAHSVTAYADAIPEDAEYFASGDFDGESAARSGYPDGSVGPDETFAHTFAVAGEYEYFCVPHESGMKGAVVVE